MNNQKFMDFESLETIDVGEFRSNVPFPWLNVRGLLTNAGFRRLLQDFPPLDLFERHEGIARGFGQRPHNRYYLAYERTIYRDRRRRHSEGVVKHCDLPFAWQAFLDELHNSKEYHQLMANLFEQDKYSVRFAWHVGFAGCEVSPHCDAANKIGTHIFYFNTAEDWDRCWGGGTVVLGDRTTSAMNPEFSDFRTAIESEITDNCSFIFQNTEVAWHGVRPLNCPQNRFRRLFNVIFYVEQPKTGEVKKHSERVAPSLFALRRALRKVRGIAGTSPDRKRQDDTLND